LQISHLKLFFTKEDRNFMKKLSALLALGIFTYNMNECIFAENFHQPNFMHYDYNNQEDDDDDDFAIDAGLNELNLNNIDTSHTLTRTAGADTVYAFFSFIDGQPTYQNAILNTPIYQQTSPIRNRPILEFPFTLTYGFDINDTNSISLTPFLNYANKKNFTKTSQTLDSYFLLGNPARIAALEYIDSLDLGVQVADNVAKSLALFDPATVEERRIGGVFEARVTHNKCSLITQLPILYVERNLYLTPMQKAAISISSIGNMLAADGVSQNDFVYEHIVMDQVGLGDFKFKAMYQAHNSNTFNIDLGGFIIVPTATAFAQGIAGVWFDANNDRAYLDLTTIDPENITTENKDEIANFFLAAVDKLSSNILNCPLGNNGHVVFAPSINFDWYFGDRWQMSNDFSLQVPLPSTEQRFYQFTQTQAQFLADYNAAYDAGADVFASYVNTQIQNMFFPFVFPTMVYPGVVFNSTNQFGYHLETTDLYLGANFWYQGAEQLKTFTNAYNNGQDYSYDYAGAGAASAAQEKIFARVNYNIVHGKYAWSISGYGDITVWNSGIGNDFTFALSVDCKF
jgi:hypothetical protein